MNSTGLSEFFKYGEIEDEQMKIKGRSTVSIEDHPHVLFKRDIENYMLGDGGGDDMYEIHHQSKTCCEGEYELEDNYYDKKRTERLEKSFEVRQAQFKKDREQSRKDGFLSVYEMHYYKRHPEEYKARIEKQKEAKELQRKRKVRTLADKNKEPIVIKGTLINKKQQIKDVEILTEYQEARQSKLKECDDWMAEQLRCANKVLNGDRRMEVVKAIFDRYQEKKQSVRDAFTSGE